MSGGRAESGFTLLELAVATALLGALSLGLMGLLTQAQAVEARAIVMADLRSKARAAVERIAREVRDSGVSTLTPPPIAPLGSSGLTFSRASGHAGSTATYGTPWRIEWRPGAGEVLDNADNDGDGLVDEGKIVWIENPSAPVRTIVMCEGVSELAAGESANLIDDNANGLTDEAGLSFDLSGDTLDVLTVRLTLARRAAKGGEVLRASAEAVVKVQNP